MTENGLSNHSLFSIFLEYFLESELPINQYARKLISTPSIDSTKSEIAYK
jgi:hypothetical protein